MSEDPIAFVPTIAKEDASSIREGVNGNLKRITPTEITEWVSTVLIPDLVAAVPEAEQALVAMAGELADLVANIEYAVCEAPTWYEAIIALAAGLDNLVDMIEQAGELAKLTGQQKLTLAYTAGVSIYNRVDKGHDGKKDRIKLPWIPGWISDQIERVVVKYGIIFGIELIMSRINRNK